MKINSKPLLVFNIGYHKTATTWWQHKIFPQINSINYIGRSYFKDPYKKIKPNIFNIKKYRRIGDINNWLNNFSRLSDQDYSDQQQLEFCNLNFKINKAKTNLLSSENILRQGNVSRIVERIGFFKKHFDVKILVFVRNQKDLIQSRYLHDIQVKYKSKFNYSIMDALSDEKGSECRWPYCNDDNICSCNVSGKKIITPIFYDYYLLFELLNKQFDEESIMFFPMEWLKGSYKEGFARLIEFLNVAVEKEKIQKLILEEKAIGQRDEAISSYFKKSQSSEELQLINFCKNYYHDSNKLISAKFNLELNSLNYP